ncbi:MAG: hypothetical protein P8P32_15040 [Akkermansiaceae bacterium]|nr:hypothetical protein [Akkermansiaceae bacterium]MDG2324935.1 hypothetical protein [Akkermansiaceae bacterium]
MKLLVIFSALAGIVTLSSCCSSPDPVQVKSNQDHIDIVPVK